MNGPFIWGAATSAYQIEGAVREDGRGESIWDRFVAQPGHIKNGDTGDVACDHYHRYAEDIELMQRLGLQAYRFSIAWPRILPEGTGSVNQDGLDFYDRLVDELLTAGIRPFATLYHWDLPQTLQDRWGGWPGRDTAAAFAEYADVVSRRLGDRVKDWITINEPFVAAWLGYGWGIHAPGERDPRLALLTSHHLLLGHGLAVPILRGNSPGARVGITLNLAPIEPAGDSADDLEMANLVDASMNRWYLDPVFKGTYPERSLNHLGGEVPGVQPGDLATIHAPLDFLGVNYYMPFIIPAGQGGAIDHPEEAGQRFAQDVFGEMMRNQHPEDEHHTAMGWLVQPEGLYRLLMRLHQDYAPATIFITENGAAYTDTVDEDGAVHDPLRVNYLDGHIDAAQRAAHDGVPLHGYFVWSLLDNFEWTEGYESRFGIISVDYATEERTIKQSGDWYAALIARS